jgi:hypothetical protein
LEPRARWRHWLHWRSAAAWPPRPIHRSRCDFSPIIQFGTAPNVLVVRPSLPVKTVRELIAYAKAQPGKLNYGSSGNGTSNHLSGALFGAREASRRPTSHIAAARPGHRPSLRDAGRPAALMQSKIARWAKAVEISGARLQSN